MKTALALLALALTVPLHAGYHVARHIPVGGTGGWDYLIVAGLIDFVRNVDRSRSSKA